MKEEITIKSNIIQILSKILKLSEEEIIKENNLSKLPVYDSLAMVTFLVACEKKYKIKFTTSDINSFCSINNVTKLIILKLNKSKIGNK